MTPRTFRAKLRHGARAACSAALLSLLLLVLAPDMAHAYLDPGTGSMLLSALVGIAATGFFMVKTFYYKIAGIFYRLTGTAAPSNGKNAIVFHSEGRQYWNTFKPVLEALDGMGVKAAYLTSGEDDPGLTHPFSHVTARYIGTGNRAFAAMNTLEACVCVTTTPGLDVLQIKRSPGVAHYIHLVHAPTDMAVYRLYSFDWFDSIMCSGPHQERSILYLEQLRKTPEKILFRTGCPYMDVLAEELEQAPRFEKTVQDSAVTRVLVAPTWGANGLLRRFGMDLLGPMAKAGLAVTIRPHPQSRVSEPGLLSAFAKALAPYPNVTWNDATSPFPAMTVSDVLISDLSGIVFDYAFILERPVITIAMDVDARGMEAGDLPYPAWELTKLPELGAHIRPEEIHDLPAVIAGLPEAGAFAERMRVLRNASLYNYRSSGSVAARQLLELRSSLLATDSK